MAKDNAKTVETMVDVSAFISGIPDKQRQDDCRKIIEIAQEQSGFEPKLWGTAIIGFGSYHYKYESGREGDGPLFAFSPRKNEFALYVPNYEGKEDQLAAFGKYKSAKACIYIKKLDDVNVEVLKKLIQGSVDYYLTKY